MKPDRPRRSRVSRSAVVAAVLAVSLVVPPGLVRAAPRTREQREADARRACAAGKVDEGIEILADLYAGDSHPNYIYNQARCYQENGRAEQAIVRFREYLRVASDAPPAVRDKVERFIAELESERQGRAAPPPLREPMPRPMPPPPAPISTTNTVTDRLPPVPPTRESSPGLRAAAAVFGVVAGVGLVGALVAGAKVSSLEKAVEDAEPGRFDVDQLAAQGRSAHRYETVQWIGYATAGAGLLGAVICIMANNAGRASRADRRWTIAGLPGGDPGLTVMRRF